MRLLVLSVVIFALLPGGRGNNIKNVVLLMEENRPFDHMFGWMKLDRPEIDGLTGNEFNPVDPSDPSSTKIFVTPNALYEDPYDPDHGYEGTRSEIFGGDEWVGPPAPMNGFVMTNARIGDGAVSMRGFTPDRVPIISTLANEFALFDKWFCSVPGPTNPNRRFLHAATADGSLDDQDYNVNGFNTTTVFDQMNKLNITWGIYYEDWSPSCMFQSLRSAANKKRFHPMAQFYKDAANGTLPQYAFIEPRMFPTVTIPANDQHPDHDVRDGEKLMRDVYLALRHSPQWLDTLYVITYDEHGGYFDHVPTPLNVPNPDGKNDTLFNFTRLGIRVPTLMISPWIDKGVLIHDAPPAQMPTATSQYEHSSVPATFTKLFGLDMLTKRAAWASTFEHVWSRATPRTDCPDTLPPIPQDPPSNPNFASKPLNDLQLSFVDQLNSCHPLFLADSQARETEQRRIARATQAEAGSIMAEYFRQFLLEN